MGQVNQEYSTLSLFGKNYEKYLKVMNETMLSVIWSITYITFHQKLREMSFTKISNIILTLSLIEQQKSGLLKINMHVNSFYFGHKKF